MPLNQASPYEKQLHEKQLRVLTYSDGIGAFASATLHETEADLGLVRPISRVRRSAPAIFAVGGIPSRWHHAASIKSAHGNKSYLQEQDHEQGE